MNEILELLVIHGKDVATTPTQKQTKSMLKKFIKPRGDIDDIMTRFVKIGGAMFPMGANFKVAQLVLSNPALVAAKLSCDPEEQPAFKSSGSILDYVNLINTEKKASLAGTAGVDEVLAELVDNRTVPPSDKYCEELSNTYQQA
eukprot:gene10158-11198_t